jgi:hypothetical protein
MQTNWLVKVTSAQHLDQIVDVYKDNNLQHRRIQLVRKHTTQSSFPRDPKAQTHSCSWSMSYTCLAWAVLAGAIRLAVQEGAILPAGLRPLWLLRGFLYLCMLVQDVSRVVAAGQGMGLIRLLLFEEEEEMDA